MATVKELEQELAQTKATLAQVLQMLEREGIVPPPAPLTKPEEMSDFIPFGSDKHRIFLGLVVVEDKIEAERIGWTVFTSEKGSHYHLADEIAAVQRGRGMDSEKAILFELRQKVGSFESGPPQVPANAPDLFSPPGANFTRIR